MDKKEIIKAIENSYKYTSEGFLIDYNILSDKILALSLPKEVDYKYEVPDNLGKDVNVFYKKREVDLDELKSEYVNHFADQVNFSGEHGDFTPKVLYEIFDYFTSRLPLQKPVESDAVEFAECLAFAEWCDSNIWSYTPPNKNWYRVLYHTVEHKTTKELYEQFKQLKK